MKGTGAELKGRGRRRGKGEDDDQWRRSERLSGKARVKSDDQWRRSERLVDGVDWREAVMKKQ